MQVLLRLPVNLSIIDCSGANDKRLIFLDTSIITENVAAAVKACLILGSYVPQMKAYDSSLLPLHWAVSRY